MDASISLSSVHKRWSQSLSQMSYFPKITLFLILHFNTPVTV